MKKIDNFHGAVSRVLTERLTKYHGKKLDSPTCLMIYQTIFDSFQELFITCEIKISNEAMNYIAQQYYDAVSINGHSQLDPNIFTQRASLDEVSTKEIALMAMMLKGTDFALPLYEKIRSRS